MLLLVIFRSVFYVGFTAIFLVPRSTEKAPLFSVLGPFVIQPKFGDFIGYHFVHFILNFNIFSSELGDETYGQTKPSQK